ncbi:MAG: signal recognition particle protein [Bacteroidota bacterium]
MFENLTDRIERSFKVLRGSHKITELNIAEMMKEIRRALVDADVNYKVAKDFTSKVKEKALGRDILINVKPGEMMLSIVHEELTDLIGGDEKGISFAKKPPTVILIAGLQGSGKTTFTGKLARHLKKNGRNPLLVAGDVYRPAAINQLTVLAEHEDVGVGIYKEEENKNPVQIAKNAIDYAKKNAHDVVVVDTAGRLAVDEEMMNEISALKDAVQPDEILFVVDSMTGQDAVNTAKAFNDRLDFDGVVLTKLDGDTRGGAAISIRTVVDKPIKFASTGEDMKALEPFNPSGMASRILGRGDVVSLVRDIQDAYDEEQAKKLQAKMRKNQFDFDDFLSQLRQIKKMGNVKDLLSKVPGMNKALKNADIPDDAFKSIEAIILSMTPTERLNPAIINGSRRKRIAKGSGTSVQEVNQLLKQFVEMKKMMKSFSAMQNTGRALRQLNPLKRRRRGRR